ncbi:MAG: carbohydrate kinase [Lachnospiraceae bacterium]|nr:carbohydrate kinase [Lachnospiraceae bacterium]
MNYVIGIDAGTTNVKAVLFDLEGREVQVESMENEPIYIGDTMVDMDMNLLWERTAECIRRVMENGPATPDEISGIGVTGQGEGCWLIDADGNPVQNSILWCDARASREVEFMTQERAELGEMMHKTTGTPPIAGGQLTCLLWMKNNRKEILDKASAVFFCKDWIRYKLTGVVTGELTDSCTTLIDVQTETVAKELLEAVGLGDYISYIKEPNAPSTIVGGVKEDVAKQLGLKEGTPVIAGAGDVCSTTLGTGVIHENEVCVALGTTCANQIIYSKDNCDFGKEETRFEKHPVKDLYMLFQGTMNGTPNIDWMLENIAGTKDFKEIDKMVESVPVGCGGVIYHPYLSVAGERSPFIDPYARANFFGISQPTTRETLVRAVYEGITLSIKDCLAGIEKGNKLFLGGGGAKSAVWAQMIADAMGSPVYIVDGTEMGAKGVSMIAGVATGMYKDYEEAVEKACHYKHIYEPNLKNTEKYDLIYELYKEIRETMSPLWKKRHQVTEKIKEMD